MDLVEELVAHGVEGDPPTGGLRLAEAGGAVGVDLRDRVRQVPRSRDARPVDAQVPAGALPGALEQVPDERAGREAVPVVPRPSVLVDERREEEGGVRDAAGDHHVGAGREGLDDRAGAEVGGGEQHRRRKRREGRAGVEVGEPAVGGERVEVGDQVVAEHGRDPEARQAELVGGVDRGTSRGRRVDPTGVRDQLHAAGRDRGQGGLQVGGQVAGEAPGLVLLAVLLQDGQRQLGERLETEVVDVRVEETGDGTGRVAVEALAAADADAHGSGVDDGAALGPGPGRLEL